MILEIAITVVMIGTTVGLWKLLYDIAIPGLRTGKIQAKGTVYSRREQPIRFWFFVVFWFLMFAMMLFLSTGMVMRILGYTSNS